MSNTLTQLTDRRTVLQTTGAAMALGLAGCTGSDDEDYPSENVHAIITSSEGGGTDQYGRVILPEVGEVLDVTMEIENIGGAATLRGTGEMMGSEPDGHTLAAFNMPSTVLASQVNDAPFNLQDVTGVATYGRNSNVAIINGDLREELGIEGYEDLLEAYEDGDIDAIAGQETGNHYHVQATQVMPEQHGFSLPEYVAYSGSGEISQAVASGEVPVGITTDSGAEPAVDENGDVQVVATFTSFESPVFPDVGTVTDEGYENIDWVATQIRGYWMPPETPEDRVEIMSEAIEDALESDAVQEWAENTGNIVEYGGPQETEDTLNEQYETIEQEIDIDQVAADS